MPLYCPQIDDGLRMQSEDLDTAAARVMELAAELDIKQEMRNRATVRSKEISTYRVPPNYGRTEIASEGH